MQLERIKRVLLHPSQFADETLRADFGIRNQLDEPTHVEAPGASGELGRTGPFRGTRFFRLVLYMKSDETGCYKNEETPYIIIIYAVLLQGRSSKISGSNSAVQPSPDLIDQLSRSFKEGGHTPGKTQ